MEVSVATENKSNVGTSFNSGESGQCSANVSLETSSSIDYMVSDCLNETEGNNQVPKEDLNECHPISKVPSNHSENKDVKLSIYEGNSKSSDNETVSPIVCVGVKNNLISKESLNESNEEECNNLHSGGCHNSDSHSDFLSAVCARGHTEKVLVELTESCDLSSVGNSAHVDAESEKILSKSNEYCSDTSNHSSNANELLSFSEEIDIKNESEEVYNEFNGDCSVSSPKVDDITEFYADAVKNKDSEFSTQDYSEELHPRAPSNEDSDTISADEKEENDDVSEEIENPERTFTETFVTGRNSSENQHLRISNSVLTNKKGKIESGNVLYQCIKCNFTDKKLEQLSLHVLTCTKKRKCGRNEAYRIDGEVPPKTRFVSTPKCQLIMTSKTLPVTTRTQSSVTSEAKRVISKTETQMTSSRSLLLSRTQAPVTLPKQSAVLTQTQGSLTSRAQPFVLTRTQIPVTSQAKTMVLTQMESQATSQKQSLVLTQTQAPITSNAQFTVTSQREFLTSQTQCATTPKSQLSSASTSQFVITPPRTQPPGVPRAVYALTTKTPCASALRSQLVMSPQTQLLRTSKPQVSATSSLLTTATEINTAQGKNSFGKNVQSISLPIQLSVTSAELTSLSNHQITSSSSTPLSIPPGTKITIGPQAQIPIVPQAPLALSPQGNLRIAQAGSQILITTNPVQPNPGAPNQPTLLGLGIGTNPTVVPKNIVLLPNLLLNSVSSSTGKVNGKQIPTQIQGQFILKNTASSQSSVAPVQLQKKIVYTAQSIAGQPSVLIPSPHVSKPVSLSVTKSPTVRIVQHPKLSFPLSAPKQPSNTVLTGVTNATSSEQSTKQATFICEICDDYVNDLEKLRNHMLCLHQINIHPKMMPSFNCQKCQFCFFTEQGLERHLVGSHGLVTASMQEAADKGKDGGRCPICGWGYQNKLLHHVSTDHKMSLKPADLSYKCTLCTATFGVYKHFEDHVYSAHRRAVSKLAPGNSQNSQPIK